MPIRVGMVSLGCSKNLVDSERMLFKLRKHGYTLVKEPGDADVVVVNTCGFIESAKQESIENKRFWSWQNSRKKARSRKSF